MVNPLIRFVKKVCVQTAVYWGNPTPDGTGGEVYDPPVEISCRWDEEVKLLQDDRGEQIVSNAQVMVTQSVDEGGMLYLGQLGSLTGAERAAPKSVAAAGRILRVGEAPLFRSTNEFVRVAYL